MRPIATHAYLTIADDLRQQIVDGTLEPGAQLPPRPEIAARYGVVAATVGHATEVLVREGMLVSRPGVGLFVRPRPEVIRVVRSWYQRPGTGSPWRAAMAELGHVGGWESDSRPCASTPAVAERLGIEPGDEVMRTEYLYTLDDAPAFLAVSYEALARTLGTPITLPEAGPHAGAGVRDRFEVIGLKPTHSEEELYVRTLTQGEAARVGMQPGASILVTQRTYFRNTLRLETADIVFPPPIRPVYQIPVD